MKTLVWEAPSEPGVKQISHSLRNQRTRHAKVEFPHWTTLNREEGVLANSHRRICIDAVSSGFLRVSVLSLVLLRGAVILRLLKSQAHVASGLQTARTAEKARQVKCLVVLSRDPRIIKLN